MENQQKHLERITMIRAVNYEMTRPIFDHFVDEGSGGAPAEGKALTLNVSSGGMLLLMDHRPNVAQLVRVQVPSYLSIPKISTLAEVAWTRPLPIAPDKVHLVGLKFLF
jgi:hypothetical protein